MGVPPPPPGNSTQYGDVHFLVRLGKNAFARARNIAGHYEKLLLSYYDTQWYAWKLGQIEEK